MNHKTEAETFRATLNGMSRPQLHEALQYLRGYDPAATATAIELAATPFFAADAELAEQAEIAHIPVGDIAARAES